MNEGWAPDPWGRHELRFHREGRWSGHVSDGGRPGLDPLDNGVPSGVAGAALAPPPPAQQLTPPAPVAAEPEFLYSPPPWATLIVPGVFIWGGMAIGAPWLICLVLAAAAPYPLIKADRESKRRAWENLRSPMR